MIISKSHNFVLLRVPKVASTSITTAIYDSELVSLGKDFCPGLEHEYIPKEDRSHKGRLAINPRVFKRVAQSNYRFDWEHWWPWQKNNPMFFAHATYSQLVQMKLIDDGMPSFAIIRNPVDRFLSVWSYLFQGLRDMGGANEAVFKNASPEIAKLLNLDPNEFFDVFTSLEVTGEMRRTPLVFIDLFRKSQTYWGGKDTEYWAIENMGVELSKLSKEKGVEEIKLQHLKKDKKKKNKNLLSQERQQAILDMFQQDFIKWESLQD